MIWSFSQHPWVFAGFVHYMPLGWTTQCDTMIPPPVGPGMWDVKR